MAIAVPAESAERRRYANAYGIRALIPIRQVERERERKKERERVRVLTWSWPKSNQTCKISGKRVTSLEISHTEAIISNIEYTATMEFAANTYLKKSEIVGGVPEGVEIVPARGIGSRAARVSNHEDGGGEGEAEGRQTEDEDERVEAFLFLNGNGGVEVVRVRIRDSSVRRWCSAAVAVGLRGSHGRRDRRRRDLQKEKLIQTDISWSNYG